MNDSLRQLAEDTYLLASNLHTGNDEFLLEAIQLDGLEPDDIDAHREWRMVELIVALGDRICAIAGLDGDVVDVVWIPDDLRDMVG